MIDFKKILVTSALLGLAIFVSFFYSPFFKIDKKNRTHSGLSPSNLGKNTASVIQAVSTPIHDIATTTSEQKHPPKPVKAIPIKIQSFISTTTPDTSSQNIFSSSSSTSSIFKPAVIPSSVPVDVSLFNVEARPAVVNILCTAKSATGLSPITGSGVIIDPRGIVVTNAHIAEFLLIKDFIQPNFVSCVVRTNNFYHTEYYAELVYISPMWVLNNKDLLKQQNPQGTGENDFAFLRITGSVDATSLPTAFSYIAPNVREDIIQDEPVLLVSYPAGFLGGDIIFHGVDETSAVTTVQKLYTFSTNTIDLISVAGTVVGQKGSSGGAVIDKNDTLIGVISTESEAKTTSQRDLRAITLGHINRSLIDHEHNSLSAFLSQDLAVYARNFQTMVAPGLSQIIENELKK